MNNRESGVLRLLIEGLANKDIAARMEVTRAQLARVAFEHYRDDSGSGPQS
jgi:FixJ family two-component response regulator